MKSIVAGQSLFPLLRLLLPINDSERHKYGLKQVTVAKAYIEALQLNKQTSKDAQRLLHWKDPTKISDLATGKVMSGDFANILEDVLNSRVQHEPSEFTIGEINLLLDDLADAVGERAKTEVIRTRILTKFNAKEQAGSFVSVFVTFLI